MTCNGKGISIWNYCIFVDSFSGEYNLLSSSKPLLLILSNVKRIWHLWGELSVIPKRMCSSYRYWLNFSFFVDSFPIDFYVTTFPSYHFVHELIFLMAFDVFFNFWLTVCIILPPISPPWQVLFADKSVWFRAFNKLKSN